MKALVVYHSRYGHVFRIMEAVAEGVREVPGAEGTLRRVPAMLAAARFQGKPMATLTAKLVR